MRRNLSAIARWLRVEHAGAPRWFLGFLAVFAVVLIAAVAAYWGR